MNNRRKLVIALGAGALSTALPAFAQQPPGKIPRIGVLWHAGTAEEEGIPLRALVQGLRDMGYIQGKNIILEHRFPNEEPERFISLAAELVQLNVDLFIAVTRPAALAAQNATKSIPIVFQAVPDPVGIKLVDSLGHPRSQHYGADEYGGRIGPQTPRIIKGGYCWFVASRAGG